MTQCGCMNDTAFHQVIATINRELFVVCHYGLVETDLKLNRNVDAFPIQNRDVNPRADPRVKVFINAILTDIVVTTVHRISGQIATHKAVFLVYWVSFRLIK